MDRPFDLATTFVKLGPDGTAEPVVLDRRFWSGRRSGGPSDRFVGVVAFESDDELHASTLERHPAADELLMVLEGAVALVVEEADGERRVELAAGQAYRVARGLWHRLEMLRPGRLLFVNSRHRMESRALGGGRQANEEENE